MKYLAFDIEAANGFLPYSICSIGIVIADTNFNILLKENIWINPKTKYNLNGTRENIGIDLNLDTALLKISPEFKEVYPKIKALLENEEYIVIGHAVESDVLMLNAACKHSKLDCINFNFICTQLLFKAFKTDKEVKGLNKIALELGVEFTQHQSDEDAYVSVLTLKYLLEQTNITLNEFLEKYAIRIGENKNFELNRTVSLIGQISKKKITQKSLFKIYKHIDKIINIPPTCDIFQGKSVAFPRRLECCSIDIFKSYLDIVYMCGGKYSSKISKCDIYVYDLTDIEKLTDYFRERTLDKIINDGKYVEKISLEDFLKTLSKINSK